MRGAEGERTEISRMEACRRIGCSVMQCQRWEKSGQIRLRRERVPSEWGRGKERVWLNEKDVDTIRRTWKRQRLSKKKRVDELVIAQRKDGELAALCLPLFVRYCVKGFDPRRVLALICAETKGHPSAVRNLYEEWILGLDGGIRERERLALELEEREKNKIHDLKKRYAEYRAFKMAEIRELKETARLKLEAARLEAAGHNQIVGKVTSS